MNKLNKIVAAILVTSPVLAFAQNSFVSTNSLITQLRGMVNNAVVLVMGIALLVFFWGLVKFIFAQGSESIKTEGKKVMVWGLIALFVMVSVWGIIQVFQRELLPGANFNAPPAPSF